MVSELDASKSELVASKNEQESVTLLKASNSELDASKDKINASKSEQVAHKSEQDVSKNRAKSSKKCDICGKTFSGRAFGGHRSRCKVSADDFADGADYKDEQEYISPKKTRKIIHQSEKKEDSSLNFKNILIIGGAIAVGIVLLIFVTRKNQSDNTSNSPLQSDNSGWGDPYAHPNW